MGMRSVRLSRASVTILNCMMAKIYSSYQMYRQSIKKIGLMILVVRSTGMIYKDAVKPFLSHSSSLSRLSEQIYTMELPLSQRLIEFTESLVEVKFPGIQFHVYSSSRTNPNKPSLPRPDDIVELFNGFLYEMGPENQLIDFSVWKQGEKYFSVF